MKILPDNDPLRSLACKPEYFKHSLADLSHEQLMAFVAFQWLSGRDINDAILTFRSIHGLPALVPRGFKCSEIVQVETVSIVSSTTGSEQYEQNPGTSG